MKNWLQCLTIKAVIEWKHEKISCENGNVVPHEVQLQAYCWRNEGLADELSKKKERKEGKSNTQVKVWHMGIRNVMKHVWRIITCCHMERGKRKCKIRPGNVKGNIFKSGYMLLFGYILGSLRNDDGSENVAKKNVNRFYMALLICQNVSDFFWSWILVDFIHLQKEKR